MKIFVKQTLTGEVIILDGLDPKITIFHVKNEIAMREANKLPGFFQTLYFGETELKNLKTLSYYNIQDLSTINLVEDTEARLHNSAASGNLQEVRNCLARGFPVNFEAPGGETPIHVASFCGHTEVVAVLIDAGATVNSQNSEGFTPIMCAAIGDQKDTVAVLLRAGADVHIKNKEGLSTLDYLRKEKRKASDARLLAEVQRRKEALEKMMPEIEKRVKNKKKVGEEKGEMISKQVMDFRKSAEEKRNETEECKFMNKIEKGNEDKKSKMMFENGKKEERGKGKIYVEVENLGSEGTTLFKEGLYDQAILKYQSCLERYKELGNTHLGLENHLNFVYKTLNNIAQCWIKKKEFMKGLEVAVEAIEQGSDLARSYIRAALCFKELKKTVYAMSTLNLGLFQCCDCQRGDMEREIYLFQIMYKENNIDVKNSDLLKAEMHHLDQQLNTNEISLKDLVLRVKKEIREKEKIEGEMLAKAKDEAKRTDKVEAEQIGSLNLD